MEIYKIEDKLYHISGRKVIEHTKGVKERKKIEINRINLQGAVVVYENSTLAIRGVDNQTVREKYPILNDYPSLKNLIGKEVFSIYGSGREYIKIYTEDGEILMYRRKNGQITRVLMIPKKITLEKYSLEQLRLLNVKEHVQPITIFKRIDMAIRLERKKLRDEYQAEQKRLVDKDWEL